MTFVKDVRALNNKTWLVGKQAFLRRKLTQPATPLSISLWVVSLLAGLGAAWAISLEMDSFRQTGLGLYVVIAFGAMYFFWLVIKSGIRPAGKGRLLIYAGVNPFYDVIFVPAVEKKWESVGVKSLIDEFFTLCDEESRLYDKGPQWIVDPEAAETYKRLWYLAREISRRCGAGNEVLNNLAGHTRLQLSVIHSELLQEMQAAETSGNSEVMALVKQPLQDIEKRLSLPPFMRHTMPPAW